MRHRRNLISQLTTSRGGCALLLIVTFAPLPTLLLALFALGASTSLDWIHQGRPSIVQLVGGFCIFVLFVALSVFILYTLAYLGMLVVRVAASSCAVLVHVPFSAFPRLRLSRRRSRKRDHHDRDNGTYQPIQWVVDSHTMRTSTSRCSMPDHVSMPSKRRGVMGKRDDRS
jgi:hypothetical protein